MPKPQVIPDDELDELFEKKEFSDRITQAAPKVAVIMTQGCCPEWVDMASWLTDDYPEAKVFQLVYDKHKRFNEIRMFKENVFHSHAIPYVRYYHGGKLVAESFYVWEDEFRGLLETGKSE